MKARGYTDAEIEHVFARYDTDGDRVLRGSEQIRFQADLAAQENNLNADIKDLKNDPNAMRSRQSIPFPRKSFFFLVFFRAVNANADYISSDEFSVVVRRMDRMEYSIGNVVARV